MPLYYESGMNPVILHPRLVHVSDDEMAAVDCSD